VSCAIAGGFYPHQIPRNNSTWPAVAYFRQSTDHQHDLSGSAGYAFVDLALDIFSPNYLDCLHASEAIRQALDGFSGTFGAVGIYSIIIESESDGVEKAGAGEGTWVYSRSLDFRCCVQEGIFLTAPPTI
jgi:hypothetical protein